MAPETRMRLGQRFMAWGERTYGSESMSFVQVVMLMLPLFLDQFFMRVINMLNTSMVSSYGPEAVAAVGMVDSFNFFLVNFFIAVATGCTVVVAQYVGRGDHYSANKATAQAVGSSLAISVLVMVLILLFNRGLLGLLMGKAEPLVREHARVFLIGSAISYPFYAVMQTVVGAQRGAGNSKILVVFTSIMNLSNVLGNFILLKVFHFGVLGLAIATVVSRVLAGVLSLVYMLRSNRDLEFGLADFFVPNMELQRSLMYVALPTSMEQIFFHSGRVLTQVFVVGFGTMSSAAHNVVTPFTNFLQVFPATLMNGNVALVGQAVGAGKPQEGKRYIKVIVLTAMVLGTATSLVMFLVLGPFLGMYNLPPEAYGKAWQASLFNLALTPLLWPVSFIIPNGLGAAGDAKFVSIAAMLTMWIVRVGGGYYLGAVVGLDMFGIWIAMLVEWGCRGLIFTLRVRGDKWYRHKVI